MQTRTVKGEEKKQILCSKNSTEEVLCKTTIKLNACEWVVVNQLWLNLNEAFHTLLHERLSYAVQMNLAKAIWTN